MLFSGNPFRMPDMLLPDRIIRAFLHSDDPILNFPYPGDILLSWFRSYHTPLWPLHELECIGEKVDSTMIVCASRQEDASPTAPLHSLR
jgi:hypothetical protein